MSVFRFHIILVEDDEDDALLATEAFKEYGEIYDIIWLKDGVELMEYLDSGLTPDLIVLDVNMPRMDGKEALTLIKSHPKLKTIPVVIFTTSYDSSFRNAFIELGANDFYTKPSELEEIRSVIKDIAEKHLIHI
jgi:two-component system response regulator